jgi:hypothetical protein
MLTGAAMHTSVNLYRHFWGLPLRADGSRHYGNTCHVGWEEPVESQRVSYRLRVKFVHTIMSWGPAHCSQRRLQHRQIHAWPGCTIVQQGMGGRKLIGVYLLKQELLQSSSIAKKGAGGYTSSGSYGSSYATSS